MKFLQVHSSTCNVHNYMHASVCTCVNYEVWETKMIQVTVLTKDESLYGPSKILFARPQSPHALPQSPHALIPIMTA